MAKPSIGLGAALAACALTALLSPTALATAGDPEPDYVYVGVRSDDRPFIDYEGRGLVAESRVSQTRPTDPFAVELSVIQLDPTRESYVRGQDVEDRLVLRLRAEIVRHGNDGLRIRGTVETSGPVTLQLVQMKLSGDESEEVFPELAFATGRHPLEVDATVVGWLSP